MVVVQKRKIQWAISLFLVMLYFSGLTAQAQYGGGTGEPNDPYQIATAGDLMLLGDSPDDYDKHFILTADIDLDPNLPGRRVFDKAIIAPDTNEATFKFNGTPFSGVFDGGDHIISHLTIKGVTFLGLFGMLDSEAKISNLGIEAIDVSGTGRYAGGLVGRNDGSITTSYSTGTVSGSSRVGGLVGENYETGSIMMSYSTGAVTGSVGVGGLVGRNYIGNITASYSTGTVTGDDYVGGLVGRNYGNVVTSYSAGTVIGNDYVGGLVGMNWSSITMSYSTGTVTGNDHVGGLVGGNRGGGITSSFWDVESSGQSISVGGTGLTTTQIQDINTYLNAGWDFVDEIRNGTCDYWQISPGDYPRLRYHIGDSPVMPEGLGTAEQPYLIRDARDLGTVWFKPSAHYRLETSVDLSGITWSMAVVPWFGGTFDSNGYVISNLHIQGGGYLGLFGQLDSGAMVSNLGLEAVDVNGTGNGIGGLVGGNWSNITASYSTGTVSGSSRIGGSSRVGGLVGVNYETGSIMMSYSTGTVTGSECVGGLVGHNYASVATSYSAGTVSGNSLVQGLVGVNYGSITSSFWDIESSGQSKGGSIGGTGLTRTEMQDINTYLNAGWDFVGEVLNGTCDYWQISPGDYPRLRYHIGDSPVMPEGLGTAEQPYLIRDARDLGTVWSKPLAHYRLETSVDLSGITWSMAVVPWFGGTFDGNGYVISNLHIEGSEYLGLFGQLGSGAMVSNLGLEAVDVNGTGDYVAGLVGRNSYGSITTSYSTGTTSGETRVGGLVGENWDGSITMSYSTGTVTGNAHVGGLVGCSWEGSITTSYSTCIVSGETRVGGLMGGNGRSDIFPGGVLNNCYSTGAVTGNRYVGGLTGINVGSIASSYSTGEVNGDKGVGGFVGHNHGSIATSYSTGSVSGEEHLGGLVGINSYLGSITGSYSTGTVTGSESIGGLVGVNYGSITTSYSTGTVTGSESVGGLVGVNNSSDSIITTSYSTGKVSGNENVGGLIGRHLVGTVSTCFWDMQTSEQTTSNGGTGMTTIEMQTASTFLDSGWDFVGESVNGTEDIWSICEGTNYPRLVWQIPAGDFVCPDGITIEDFVFFAEYWRDETCDLSNDYCQGTDLDFSGTVDEADLEIFVENWLAGVRSD